MSEQINRGPARIIILRHAEKTGVTGDRELSERGKLRAAVLASALPTAFGKVDVIVAAKTTERSARPQRTVEPLAIALGLSVDQYWNTGDYLELARWIDIDAQLDGKHLVICWRHKVLAQLAHSLGANGAPPWPEPEYDWIWVLDSHNDSRQFTTLMQKLDGKVLTISDH